MKYRKPRPSSRALPFDPVDEVDPVSLYAESSRARRDARKTSQLCAQVLRSLVFALSDTGDPLLSELTPASVEPAPNCRRLRVTLVAPPGFDAARAADRLSALAARLRSIVAADIRRKRAPELALRLIVPPAWRIRKPPSPPASPTPAPARP